MSIENLFEYKAGEYQTVTRMLQYPPGSGVVYIRDPNRVKMAGYDIEIWDAETGGTQLIEDTDYTLGLVDADLSALEGFAIYGGFQVINAAYQSIELFITAKIVGGYTTRPYAPAYVKITSSASITLDSMDDAVLADTTGGDITITLGDGDYANQRMTVIVTGANDVYVNGTGIPLTAYNSEAVVFVWYSTKWYIVGGATSSGTVTQEPAGYIYGLETAADTDADHDVTISPGKCRSYSDLVSLSLSADLTKQIDASWTVGDNAGGLFAGTVAADTTYHMFLIRKDSDGTIDAGWDTDIDCANIPTGYTAYRRIASFYTDSSANIRPTVQAGNYFEYKTPVSDTIASVTSTRIAHRISIPSGKKMMLSASIGSASAVTSYVNISDPDINDTPSIPSYLYGDFMRAGSYASISSIRKATNTSAQLSFRSQGTISNLYVNISGWEDDRGQYGGK